MLTHYCFSIHVTSCVGGVSRQCGCAALTEHSEAEGGALVVLQFVSSLTDDGTIQVCPENIFDGQSTGLFRLGFKTKQKVVILQFINT